MTLPSLTPDERAAAMRKATGARRERAAVKVRLREASGSLGATLAAILDEASSSEALAKMKVSDLLEAVPGVGPIKTRRLMADLSIAPSRRLRGLGRHQRAALVERFADR